MPGADRVPSPSTPPVCQCLPSACVCRLIEQIQSKLDRIHSDIERVSALFAELNHTLHWNSISQGPVSQEFSQPTAP